jgi:hypothetical protein
LEPDVHIRVPTALLLVRDPQAHAAEKEAYFGLATPWLIFGPILASRDDLEGAETLPIVSF